MSWADISGWELRTLRPASVLGCAVPCIRRSCRALKGMVGRCSLRASLLCSCAAASAGYTLCELAWVGAPLPSSSSSRPLCPKGSWSLSPHVWTGAFLLLRVGASKAWAHGLGGLVVCGFGELTGRRLGKPLRSPASSPPPSTPKP